MTDQYNISTDTNMSMDPSVEEDLPQENPRSMQFLFEHNIVYDFPNLPIADTDIARGTNTDNGPRTDAPEESNEEDSEEEDEDPMARLTPCERENEILLKMIHGTVDKLYAEYAKRGGFGGEVLGDEEFRQIVVKHLFDRRKSQASLQDIEKIVKKAEENRRVATEVPPEEDADFLKWASKEIRGHSWELASQLDEHAGYRYSGRTRASGMTSVVAVLRKHLDYLEGRVRYYRGQSYETSMSGDHMSGVAWKLDDVANDLEEHRKLWKARVETLEQSLE